MGDYKWKSFSEVDHLATSFGKGLRELGNKPRENVVIFAETRAEWMISAHGCFKQSIPGKYIYNSQLKNLNATSVLILEPVNFFSQIGHATREI